jgi:hypothetical protein
MEKVYYLFGGVGFVMIFYGAKIDSGTVVMIGFFGCAVALIVEFIREKRLK